MFTRERCPLYAGLALAVLLLPGPGAGAARAGVLVPGRLRVEARTNPLGLDVAVPRLSWIVSSPERAQRQTAYQVVVATTPGGLAEGRGVLWDSGKVASDETIHVEYRGAALKPHQRAYWRVRVWDRDGQPSAWSEPAMWSAGPGADWKAAWIGYDAPRESLAFPEADFAPAKWIWHPNDRDAAKPKAHRLFVTTLAVPADATVEKAELLVSADDQYKFTINGELVADSGTNGYDKPRLVSLPTRIKAGPNTIRVEVYNAMPGPAGLLAKLNVTLAGGKLLTLVTDESWKALDNPGANWHNRPLDTDGWPVAAVVGQYGDAPWGKLKLATLILPPPVLLRTEFTPAKPVRQATLYASALGIVEPVLNGRSVSDEFFTPGWTDYTKRVLYRAYDVTGLVQPNRPNVLGAILGDGWYSGYIGFARQRDHYGKQPRAKLLLHVEYADGTSEDVVTNNSWWAGVGPIKESDFLMGETFDARDTTLANWQRPDFDLDFWATVNTGSEMDPALQWHAGPPVRVVARYPGRPIRQPGPGRVILDFGRNFAGIPRLTLRDTKPGQTITLRFAERLNPDGSLYTTNYRDARSLDTYTCAGGPVEVFQPRFTFHGFQYAEIAGLDAPTTAEVVGLALASDTPMAGSFACDDAMLNQLHQNIVTTQLSNFIDIPTDCPQRDERLGWTGDAQVYIRTATLNADVQAFFTKWLQDLADGQRADGQFPMIAPVKVAGDDGGPAWADAGVICPWTTYEVYGDRRLLERQYPSMVKFVEFCRGRSRDGVLPPAQYHAFGDWLSINAETPKDVIYTAYYALSTRLTARAAEVLGKSDDAKRFGELYEQIKAAFQKAYVKPDGRIEGDTQAVYVLALAVDLVDGELAKQAAGYLVENIEARGGHLSTGFIGTKDLMLVLAKIGRNDVAYRLLHNDTFPSWGFSIKQGATSIWERWDGWTPEKGFQDPGMNSFAHYSFGAVYQWMVENIGGIREATPSYRTFVVAPQPGGKLNTARIGYDSVRGPIASAWTRDTNGLTLEVTVPANTTATVRLPAADASAVTESGRPLAGAAGVGEVKAEAGVVSIPVGSGTYRFAMPAPR
jgi:alpha-L-rhamnosidase